MKGFLSWLTGSRTSDVGNYRRDITDEPRRNKPSSRRRLFSTSPCRRVKVKPNGAFGSPRGPFDGRAVRLPLQEKLVGQAKRGAAMAAVADEEEC